MTYLSRAVRAATLCLAVVGLLAATAPSARADSPLRTSPNPMFVQGGIGPGIGIGERGFGGAYAFLPFEFGYHFGGTGEGPFIGAGLGFGFTSTFMFELGGRFGWDIQIIDGLLISPNIQAGFAIFAYDGGRLAGGGTYAAFDLYPSVDVKAVFDGTWLLFARPIGFDIFIGDGGAFAAYTFLVGAGITF